VDNNYLDLGMNKSGFVHTLPVAASTPTLSYPKVSTSILSYPKRSSDIIPFAAAYRQCLSVRIGQLSEHTHTHVTVLTLNYPASCQHLLDGGPQRVHLLSNKQKARLASLQPAEL
jgi:hypothetical protein